jgi:hypothetical protein
MNKKLILLFLLVSGLVHGQQGCPKGHVVKSLEAKYSNVKEKALIYQQAGMGLEYVSELQKLQKIVDEIPYAYLQQEISSFPLTRDPRCMALAYSQIIGQEVVFQPRSDGKWNVLLARQLVHEGLSDHQLQSLVKLVQ